MTNYGVLMCYLLRRRAAYATEEEFRQFLQESLGELCRDLRNFDIEISIRPNMFSPRRRAATDLKTLQLGCE